MTIYNSVARHLLAPVLDFSRGTKTIKCLKELEQSQWWSRDKILELQNQRLRQLIRHAYDNVPYYRRIFDERGLKPEDIKDTEALVKLPVLTKKLIRSNFEDLTAIGFPYKEVIMSSTGGSTGEPLKFYSTKDAHYSWGFAAGQRAFGWAGYHTGEKCVLLHERRTFKSATEKLRQIAAEFFERVLFFDAKEISSEGLPLFIHKLEGFQPAFIRGYPSLIYMIAKFTEHVGGHNIKLKAIITGGEELYDYQRELFSKVFKCETYDHYGSYEVWSIAAECQAHSGYHIAAENVVVEILDDKGEPVPLEMDGRIIVTNLHNFAMPFVRYDIGDIGAMSAKACSCGRGLPLLINLSGRSSDLILTRNRGFISGTSLPWDFLSYFGVKQFQIVQKSREHVIFNLVIDKEYPQAHRDSLTKEIISRYQPILGEDMNIAVEFVDQIPVTRAGKRRVVVSNIETVDY